MRLCKQQSGIPGLVGFALLLSAHAAGASTTSSSLSGTVEDAQGRYIAGAEIVANERGRDRLFQTRTDRQGHFSLPVLPVDQYDVLVSAPGFAPYQRLGVFLSAGAAMTVDARLDVGSVTEAVVVNDATLHAETVSTELGQALAARQIAAVPLNGRSYTDLLSLLPGVAPETSITTNSIDDLGAQILNPSGSLNPGTLSVNGQREFANFFSVDGSDVEEDVNAGAAIIPNLDSIAEFRIVTSNFDAEYGEFSGGQVSVTTKSGSNQLHGSAFDFLRNTALDARNYFSATRGVFRQNQFGGTAGGPLRKDRVFFFVDYQGTRQTQGVDTGDISVASNADRTGQLLDASDKLTRGVSGPYLASLLSTKLGYPVSANEPYSSPGCATAAVCVFPNATIPQAAWSTPAQRLLHYIPTPNNTSGTFSTSAFNQTLRDDKRAVRLDANARGTFFSAYYFLDDYRLDNPYPVAQGGASVPGFDALNTGRAQLLSLGMTQNLGSKVVNEAHLSFLRDKNDLGKPLGGSGVSLVSQGFSQADGSSSIVALDPRGQSVENIVLNGYSFGAASSELLQVNNTYQVRDVFSRIAGEHSLKLGGEFHADEVNDAPIAQFNGSFVFSGTETGDDFADFLLGVPSQYNQSQLNPFYARNKYVGLFAQDSWHLRPNLTLNYGLRWDRIAPWTEKYNQISTFAPGAQSVVFPGAPAGILYPGDPGVPETLAKIEDSAFAPRVGLAWSPQGTRDRWGARLLGAPGTTTVRASFGQFYTSIDALTIGVLAANAPYGTTYTSPAPPLFATPFVTAASGMSYGQPFPYTFAPRGSSAQHPDASIDWSSYEPISGIPAFAQSNRTPYTEERSLSLERQAGPHAVLDATYVGNASRRQRVLVEANAGNPSLCLSLSKPSEVRPGTLTCGPNGEDTVYYPAAGGEVDGTRSPLGPAFGSNALQSTLGHASYNALQLSARYSTATLELSAAYTWSKSLDLASNVGEDVNPTNPELSYALSSFDVRHNASLSYSYQLPFDRWIKSRALASGWVLSGITHIATGFPVTLINNGDNSLLGTNPNGVNNSSVDEPDRSGTQLKISSNPRVGNNGYFNPGAFSMNAPGTPGTARRRFFYGPGSQNYDASLAKVLPVTETKSIEARIEAFNMFNHAQFNGPSAVDGDIGSSTFGRVIGAAAPRLLQAALKLNF